MSRGRPPLACSRRRTWGSCRSRSTGWPPAPAIRARNSSTAGPSRGSLRPGTGSGPSRTTCSCGLPATVAAVQSRRNASVDSMRSSHRSPSPSMASTPSRTSRTSWPSRARLSASERRVARGHSAPSASRQAVTTAVDAGQALSRRPTRPRVGGHGVPGDEGLAAPGRAGHGHPPLAVEEAADAVEGVLPPHARRQHQNRLSRRDGERSGGLTDARCHLGPALLFPHAGQGRGRGDAEGRLPDSAPGRGGSGEPPPEAGCGSGEPHPALPSVPRARPRSARGRSP